MEGLPALALFIAAIALYFLPSIVAGARKHHNENAIMALNLFLGWTFLGWVASLVWALTAVRRELLAPAPEEGTSVGAGLLIILGVTAVIAIGILIAVDPPR